MLGMLRIYQRKFLVCHPSRLVGRASKPDSLTTLFQLINFKLASGQNKRCQISEYPIHFPADRVGVGVVRGSAEIETASFNTVKVIEPQIITFPELLYILCKNQISK